MLVCMFGANTEQNITSCAYIELCSTIKTVLHFICTMQIRSEMGSGSIPWLCTLSVLWILWSYWNYCVGQWAKIKKQNIDCLNSFNYILSASSKTWWYIKYACACMCMQGWAHGHKFHHENYNKNISVVSSNYICTNRPDEIQCIISEVFWGILKKMVSGKTKTFYCVS